LLLRHTSRDYAVPLGAGVEQLLRILSGHVYLAALLGSNGIAASGSTPLILGLAATGTALFVYALILAGIEFRLFVLFSILVFVGSLATPNTGNQGKPTQWNLLTTVPGVRYWFFPTLSFAWGIVWLTLDPQRPKRVKPFGVVLLAIMIVGLARDWRYRSYPDVHFAEYARKLSTVPRGEAVILPETPPGWVLRLVKR
jgi:hypothetical protein